MKQSVACPDDMEELDVDVAAEQAALKVRIAIEPAPNQNLTL